VTGKDRLADEADRHTPVQSLDHRPLARALLARGIENLVHQRRTIGIPMGQHLGRDLHQVALQGPLVPVGEHLGPLLGAQAEMSLEQMPGFGDQLHVAVLDAVVHHFHVVAGSALPHPLATSFSRFCPGGDGAQHVLHVGPGRRIAARHDAGAEPGSLLATRYTAADEQNALGGERSIAALGIEIVGIAPIDEDIASLQQRQQALDDAIHYLASLHHQHDAARPSDGRGERPQVEGRQDGGAVADHLAHKILGQLLVVIPDRHAVAMVVQVQNQVLAHDGQTDYAKVDQA